MPYPHGYPAHIQHADGTFSGSLIAADPPSWPTPVRTSSKSQTAAASAPAQTQRRKREPRKLDNIKCAQCRHDKVKCNPQPRLWPQKCARCESKGFDCSEGEVKRRTRRRLSPTSHRLSSSGTTQHNDQASNVRRTAVQGSVEPGVEIGEGDWDCTDLTNLVTFVQLLNHERSLLAETDSTFSKLNFGFDLRLADLIHMDHEAAWLDHSLPKLTKDVRKVLHNRQQSEDLAMTDQILYQNAYEAIGEDFVVPRHEPISEESLAKLSVGVQIRYLIRKLRLDIYQHGSCDFKPLDKLVGQLMLERSAWQERFGAFISFFFDRVSSFVADSVKRAAYSLVVSQELLSEVLTRTWIRDHIIQFEDQTSPFQMSRFVELWNADRGSADLITLVGSDAGYSKELPLLHVAVLCNKPRIVQALLKDIANPSCESTIGSSFHIFHCAAVLDFNDCYRILLQCEGTKSVKRGMAYNGNLPLHIAAGNGNKSIVEMVLSLHSDDQDYVNERNWSDKTPLILAAEFGHYDVVQFLLDYPRVKIAAYDDQGKTALVYAGENEDIVRLILSKLPEQYFNTLDYGGDFDGCTTLHTIAEYAGPKAIRLVLSFPSILPDKEDRHGLTPLCYAVRSGNLEAVKALGIRRDVDLTKLSTFEPIRSNFGSYIAYAKGRAENGNKWSQILDWLKMHCKELEADLADWEIGNEGTAQDARESGQNTEEEE